METKKPRSKAYSRTKGHSAECKIAKELRDLGFEGVVTSRSESKSTDDNKIDVMDTNGKLPINIQIKKTQSTPSYFTIRDQCTDKTKPFCIIWNKQKKKEKNICSVGEVAIIPKEFLYELLKLYLANNENIF